MLIRLAAAIGLLISAIQHAPDARAQSYPSQPVKLIVTTGAGAAPDVIARILGDGLAKLWNQQVFVTNHPGAAGSIGMKVAGTAPPDGYTLLFALSSSFVALPEIAKGFPYDLERDFVPIGFVVEQPMAVRAPRWATMPPIAFSPILPGSWTSSVSGMKVFWPPVR